ncbi:MAG: ATP-binding protein [Aeromonadaceae bacterium]|nr:ATP-binding protein [Aeromonadaceae bacterium]
MRWALAQQLQSLGGGEIERQALLLGVTELVTNTVRHSSPSAAIFRVVIWQQGEEKWLEIRDDGAPFDPVLHGLLAQRITAPSRGMRDQGYGLLLVANFLPALSYRRLAEVNCYRLPLVA